MILEFRKWSYGPALSPWHCWRVHSFPQGLCCVRPKGCQGKSSADTNWLRAKNLQNVSPFWSKWHHFIGILHMIFIYFHLQVHPPLLWAALFASFSVPTIRLVPKINIAPEPWKHPALSFSPVQVPSSIGVVLGLTTIEPSRLGRFKGWQTHGSKTLKEKTLMASEPLIPWKPSVFSNPAKQPFLKRKGYILRGQGCICCLCTCCHLSNSCLPREWNAPQFLTMSHPWVLHPLWQLLFGFEWHSKSLQLLQGTAEQPSFLRAKAKWKNGPPSICLGIGWMFKITALCTYWACWSLMVLGPSIHITI